MQIQTRLLFEQYTTAIARLNALPASFTVLPGELKQFNVAPVIEQKLQGKLQLTSDFLSRINVIPVIAQQGERVGVGVGRTLAGRTDTSNGQRRNPADIAASDSIDTYFAKKTDYDYSWKYALLDAWAHRPEFQQLVRDAVIVAKANDIITIGFNGTSAADQTDRVANPLLADVNFGWLYKMRTYAPARCMSSGSVDPTVKNGQGVVTHQGYVWVDEDGYNAKDANGHAAPTADYANLDALVFDVKHNLLFEGFRTATDLVVIVGSDLVHDKYFKIVSEAGDVALNQLARDVILSSRQLGGLPTMQVPFFPANALMVTSLKNLSYYWQVGTARRAIKDEPEYNRVANYESINDAFMVEEYGKAALVENIRIGTKPA